MDEAAECDELILMREGRVLTVDTPTGLRTWDLDPWQPERERPK